MAGVTISALNGVNTILGTEEIPLAQSGVTSSVTPALLAVYFNGVNTQGTVTSVNVSGGTTGLSFTGGPIHTSGTITMLGGLNPVNGGTGLASYAVGDLLYATAATTLSRLAGVATGNALISGGVTTAPAWGKIGLATHISGTLTTGNGGTNTTSTTGTGSVVFSNGPTLVSPVLGTVTSGVLTNCTVATASTFTNSTVLASTAYADRIGVQQVVSTITGAVATGTTTIPNDDTIPQNTEGDQYMSLAITPKSATSKLVIDVIWNGSISRIGGDTVTLALFQDSTANALAAVSAVELGTNMLNMSLRYSMTSGTTSSTTFKVRFGANAAGTTTFNGQSSARTMGGVMASSIIIMEVGS